MEGKTFHIIGICGIGMSAIAQVLKSEGNIVQGSDRGYQEKRKVDEYEKYNGKIKRILEESGITVFLGHDAKYVINTDVVIYSRAIKADNEELAKAKSIGIELWSRAYALAMILKEKYVIAISGCHGKTTTTAMIGEILYDAGLEPTILCGGIMQRFKNNVKLGKSKLFVIVAIFYYHTLPGTKMEPLLQFLHHDTYSTIQCLPIH